MEIDLEALKYRDGNEKKIKKWNEKKRNQKYNWLENYMIGR